MEKLSKPEDFSRNPKKDSRIKLSNEFESLCALIEDNSSCRAKDLTLYEFVSRIEYIKEKRKMEAKVGIKM